MFKRIEVGDTVNYLKIPIFLPLDNVDSYDNVLIDCEAQMDVGGNQEYCNGQRQHNDDIMMMDFGMNLSVTYRRDNVANNYYIECIVTKWVHINRWEVTDGYTFRNWKKQSSPEEIPIVFNDKDYVILNLQDVFGESFVLDNITNITYRNTYKEVGNDVYRGVLDMIYGAEEYSGLSNLTELDDTGYIYIGNESKPTPAPEPAIKSNYSLIADAIRSKTGKSDLMTAADMPNEIASIPSGGDIPDENKIKKAANSDFKNSPMSINNGELILSNPTLKMKIQSSCDTTGNIIRTAISGVYDQYYDYETQDTGTVYYVRVAYEYEDSTTHQIKHNSIHSNPNIIICDGSSGTVGQPSFAIVSDDENTANKDHVLYSIEVQNPVDKLVEFNDDENGVYFAFRYKINDIHYNYSDYNYDKYVSVRLDIDRMFNYFKNTYGDIELGLQEFRNKVEQLVNIEVYTNDPIFHLYKSTQDFTQFSQMMAPLDTVLYILEATYQGDEISFYDLELVYPERQFTLYNMCDKFGMAFHKIEGITEDYGRGYNTSAITDYFNTYLTISDYEPFEYEEVE